MRAFKAQFQDGIREHSAGDCGLTFRQSVVKQSERPSLTGVAWLFDITTPYSVVVQAVGPFYEDHPQPISANGDYVIGFSSPEHSRG